MELHYALFLSTDSPLSRLGPRKFHPRARHTVPTQMRFLKDLVTLSLGIFAEFESPQLPFGGQLTRNTAKLGRKKPRYSWGD